MTILTGDVYKVETLKQFVNRTHFTKCDVLRAARDEAELLQDYNEMHAGEDYFDGPADELEAMFPSDIDHYFNELDVTDAIIQTLEQDDGDWIHLTDGVSIHTIVEVFD